jgi:rRNA maturation endonuclease Nob1
MLSEKKKKITATGILTCNLIVINDHTVEWLEAGDFSLTTLARSIGIDHEHKAKATITIELVEEPCILCGKPVAGDKICQNCGKPICDECAKTDQQERYCPVCQVLNQTDNQSML